MKVARPQRVLVLGATGTAGSPSTGRKTLLDHQAALIARTAPAAQRGDHAVF